MRAGEVEPEGSEGGDENFLVLLWKSGRRFSVERAQAGQVLEIRGGLIGSVYHYIYIRSFLIFTS